ncbi:MAG TPA: porin [Tepidisphaeraceae bacterium]|nr:porin [Tepidisphaeraceae bacterium]
MKREFGIVAASLAASIGLGASRGFAQTDQSADIAALKSQINALQQQVNQLQAQEEKTAADNAATTRQVIDDAARESQFLPPASFLSTYDPNVGFVIRSPDGQFSFHPGALFDFREMTSYREETPHKVGAADSNKNGEDTESGFDVTRMRLTFDGNYGKDLKYFIQFQDDQGTTFGLYDAYATFHIENTPFSIRGGQFKDPVFHERLLSEMNLLAVDRTETESFFGGGQTSRVQGVSLLYDQGQARAQLAIDDGYNTINTKFFDQSSASASPAGSAGLQPPDFGAAGRVEYALIGQRDKNFNPFSEYDSGFTALGDTRDILVAGAAADYTQAGASYLLLHTIDAQYDSPTGLSLYGAYLASYRDLDVKGGKSPVKWAPGSYYDPGFVGQVGYLLTRQIEPFARYDYTYLQGGSTTRLNDQEIQEVAVGVNYYLYGQHAKFTVDGVWLPNGAPVDNDAFGILQDSGHNEFVLRFQFQLAI